MRGRSRKICALLLSAAMSVSCMPLKAEVVWAEGTDKVVNAGTAGTTKVTETVVKDDFSEGLSAAWYGNVGEVSCDGGALHLSSNGSVSSIKRNVGNGDFTVETKWSGYSADTSGNNSVVIFRVSDGTENNLIEIQRFSNGTLSLLLINDLNQTSFTTSTSFSDTEGWFKLGYDSAEQKVIAYYKAGDNDEYIPLKGNGERMSNFGGAHVAECRAQKWGGSAPVSVDFNKFNSTFVREAIYKEYESVDFSGPVLTDDWYGKTGDVSYGGGRLALKNSGSGISTVKKNMGDKDYSIEAKWSEFSSDETGGAILRVSMDSSETDFAQMMRKGDGTLCFTVVKNNTAVEKVIPYTENYGWLRIDYDSQTKEVSAFYRVDDHEPYTLMPGSGIVADTFAGLHTAELIVDDWGAEGSTSASFEQLEFAYNEEVDLKLKSDYFNLKIDEKTGAIFELSNPQDAYGTNYVMNSSIKPAFDVDDSRWTGDVKFTLKKGNSAYYPALTSWSDDVRTISRQDDAIKVSYDTPSEGTYGIKDFAMAETYHLSEDGSQLNWSIDIQNTSGETLEIADLGLSFLMNSWWQTNQEGIYEQNVARHSYVAEDGSYIYWQRPNGDGSFLVMTPQDGTSLEFKDKARFGEGPFAESDPSWEGLVEYFIHSGEISKTRAGGYLPSTSLTLKPDEKQTYGFTFQWASNYSDLREILYNAGSLDAVSLPGMVIPKDMSATLAVRSKHEINSVTGDSSDVKVTRKEDRNGYQIYDIQFSKLGKNNVTVNYGNDKKSVLQYYSTESIETLIEKNTDFLVKKQQAKTDKGYNGAYLQWNMATGKLITWDDYPGGGWKTWMAGGSDDAGLAPAVYLSEKNITAPDKEQIESLEYYLKNFIWGYMQQHDTYKVYRWYDGTEGAPSDKGTWRSYNYVHIANTYYNMYQIAKRYPEMTAYLKADEYLLRCYNTLKAYFTYGMFDGHNYENGGRGAYIFGNMGEMNLPEILTALEKEGHSEEHGWLAGKVREKADIIFAESYPFASEMSIDTTGFETCYTLAKMYDNQKLADKVMSASLACRGMQPLWYYYGSDNRHMGESWWNLGYETQLGAWQQQDYLRTYGDIKDEDFDDMMRGTYGAYLAGWANINVGQISDKAVNYGAASWQYQSEKGTNGYSYIPSLDGWWAWSGEASLGFWGGLKTASANIVEDDIVGLYGYGCALDYTDGIYHITPKDGVRTRLTMYNKNKFSMGLDKARYTGAEISDDLGKISLTLENVTERAFAPEITLDQLPKGKYEVVAGGKVVKNFTSDGSSATFSLELSSDKEQKILIQRKQTAIDPEKLEASADPDSSFCSPWETIDAVNDGITGSASLGSDCSHWGTWDQNRTTTEEWVTYSWTEPVEINKSEIYFFDNSKGGDGGVQVPASYRYEYLNEAGVWTAVSNPKGLGVEQDKFNVTTFDTVKTKSIRVTLVKKANVRGVGINEWKVSKSADKKPLPFIDVSEKDWFYDSVSYVNEKGIMTGITADMFAPGRDLSRAQFTTILYRMAGSPKAEYDGTFQDVKAGQFYTDAVAWAKKNKIVTGYAGTDRFEPDKNISREEMAVMLYRYAKYSGQDVTASDDLSAFEDKALVSEFAKEALSWAVGSKFISGVDGKLLMAQATASRAECAALIQRYLV